MCMKKFDAEKDIFLQNDRVLNLQHFLKTAFYK